MHIKERCVSPTGLAEIDCVRMAEEAAREGKRKEQALATQNITAWWTKVIVIAAFIGMALSAVGIWFVKTTFDETRKAGHISKETMFRQLPADAIVQSIEWDQSARVGDYLDFVCVNIVIHNSGPMRASAVKIEYSRIQTINRVIVFYLTRVRMLDIWGASERNCRVGVDVLG